MTGLKTVSRDCSGISVIVPAFDEEGGIDQTIKALNREVSAIGVPFEILVVDDGSTDNTKERARSAGAIVLSHTHNKGYGAALKTGIRHASYEVLCITDADGTYPEAHIPEMLAQLSARDADMIVGARTGTHVAIPLSRRPAKWVLKKLAEFVSNSDVPDLNSGLRVFRRDTVMNFFSLLPDGFSFTTTITLGMIANGYSIGYLPINYYPRVGRSKIQPIRDTLNFLKLVCRIALYFAPLKIFMPLSAMFFLAAVLWGIASKVLFGVIADISTLLIALAAVQIGMLGLIAELVNHRVVNAYRRKEGKPSSVVLLYGVVEPLTDAMNYFCHFSQQILY